MAVKFLSSVDVTGTVSVSSIANDNNSYTGIVVWDGTVLKYRTKAEILSDIGAGTGGGSVTDVSLGTLTGLSGSVANSTSTPTITLTNTDKGSSQYIFKTVAVSGQTSVTASSNSTTLTMVAAGGMTITTDNSAKSITLNSANDNDNNYVDNVTWDSGTGVITLERGSLADLTVDIDGRYVEKTGDTMTGNLLMDNCKIDLDIDSPGYCLQWKEADSTTLAGQLRAYNNRGDIYLYSQGVQTVEITAGTGSYLPDLTVDNIYISGTEIDSTAELLLDATNDITIDAGGGDIILQDDGTIFGTLSSSSGLQVRSRVNNADMFLRGVDNNVEFTALQLDMSAAGAATFNDIINMPNNKAVTWANSSVRGEGNILKLTATSEIQLQQNTTITGGALSITGDGSNAATLTESGSGDFTIVTVDDLRLDAGGDDIVLRGSGTEFGRLTLTQTGFKISSSATNSSIQIVPNGTGGVFIPDYIRHLADPSDDTYFGFSANDTFVVYTAGGKGIEVDSNRNVQLPAYGSGSVTGTTAYTLAVDSSGNIIETTDGGGSVTSVGYTHAGNAFTVGGSPVTSSGTLAVTMAGTSSQYIDGAGNLATSSALPFVDGSGTANKITKWSDTDTVTDSSITDDGTDVNFTSPVIITDSLADYSTPFITLWNDTNGGGAGIEFSDQASSRAQKGYLTFYHSDGASQGGGASIKLTSTESDFVLVVGGPSTNGRVSVYSGASNTEPDYGFYDDQDTGMLRPGANALRFVTGGTAAIDINSSQQTILQVIPSVGSDTDKFLMSNNGIVSFATGAEVLSYIGAGTGSGDVTEVQASTSALYDGLNVVNGTGPVPVVGINIPSLTALSATPEDEDLLIIYDEGVPQNKKITVANLIGAAPQGTVTGTGTAGTVTKWSSGGTGIEDGPITFAAGANGISTFGGKIISSDHLISNGSNPNLQLLRTTATTQLWELSIDSSGRLLFQEAASAGGTQYTRMQIDDPGNLTLNAYGSGTFTGTVAKSLTVDSSGNVIESTYTSGTVTSIATGDGITGGTITSSGTVSIDYCGNDNAILIRDTEEPTKECHVWFSWVEDNCIYKCTIGDVVAHAPQGTIQNVIAGTALTGGGTTGAVTLNLGIGNGLVGTTTSVAVKYTNSSTNIIGSAGAGTAKILADSDLFIWEDASDGIVYQGDMEQICDYVKNCLRGGTIPDIEIEALTSDTVSISDVNGYVLLGDSAKTYWGTAKDAHMFYNGTSNKLFLELETSATNYEITSNGTTKFIFTRSGGNFTASGNVTGFSDERLKDNIETLDGSKVLEMRGVSFIKDGAEGSGVIAQELEKVAPELVHTADDEMGTKSVAYGNMVGYLIEAVKDQQKQIDELKAKLESYDSSK